MTVIATVRVVAVKEYTLLDLLSDLEERFERKDLAKSEDAATVELLAGTISILLPPGPRYQS